MTLEEAFKEFIESANFKEIAKRKDIPEGGKYRQYKKRYSENTLGKAAMIELLEANGYELTADKVEKNNKHG